MKMNTLSLSTSLAILLSIGVVFAADDHKYPTQIDILQAPTFKTYTEISKKLDTKPSLPECYDLYNPIKIINDIYVELDQFEKSKIPAATLKNLFLKWTFAQRFHFKLSGDLIDDSLCAVSLDDLMKAKKITTGKENKYLSYLKITTKFDPKYSDIRQIVKSFDAAEELKNLDTRIDQIITHLLTFPCFKALSKPFPFKGILTQKPQEVQENLTLLGVSSALMIFHIDPKNQPIDKSIQYYHLAAQGGSRGAMTYLGFLLKKKGTLDVLKKAETWCRKAADIGEVSAMYNLGLLLKEKGTPEALEEAEKWYRKAADKEFVFAMTNLSVLLNEKDTPEAREEAETWYRKAADKGAANAMSNLGVLLKEKGTPKALEEAESLLRKAIDNGDIGAMSNLGILLYEKGTPEALEEAQTLFTEALTNGISNSLIFLAQLSDEPVEAENHFKEAIRLNVPNALIYYADFLREKDRIDESATYQDIYEEENGITIDHSSESDTDSDSDLQTLTPDLTAASSSSAIETAPVASSSSKPNIASEEPFILSTTEEKYQAPIIPKKQQKKDARNARMEEQIKRADKETKKAILTQQPTLKTYQDITVIALPDAIGEIAENEIKVQRLITMLANGETKRGKLEQLQDGVYSMRITKQDRFVFRITGGDLEKGITAIQIIEAKGHYKHTETRTAQTTDVQLIKWSNLG